MSASSPCCQRQLLSRLSIRPHYCHTTYRSARVSYCAATSTTSELLTALLSSPNPRYAPSNRQTYQHIQALDIACHIAEAAHPEASAPVAGLNAHAQTMSLCPFRLTADCSSISSDPGPNNASASIVTERANRNPSPSVLRDYESVSRCDHSSRRARTIGIEHLALGFDRAFVRRQHGKAFVAHSLRAVLQRASQASVDPVVARK